MSLPNDDNPAHRRHSVEWVNKPYHQQLCWVGEASPLAAVLGGWITPEYAQTLDTNKRAGIPCWILLEDFGGVMRHKERWPDHICPEVAGELAEQWARARVLQTIGGMTISTSRWREEHPLPVGVKSLGQVAARIREEVARGIEPNEDHIVPPAALKAFAVFPGDEEAHIATSVTIGETTVSVFGLLERVYDPENAEDPDPYLRTYGPMRFQATGNPLDPEVQRFCKLAAQWWRTIQRAGPVPRGGQKRKPFLSYEKFCALWQTLKAEYAREAELTGTEDQPLSPTEFVQICAEEAGVVERTVWSRINEWRSAGKAMPWD